MLLLLLLVGGEEGAVALARELEAMEEAGEAQKLKDAAGQVLAALQEEGEEHATAGAAASAVRMHGGGVGRGGVRS